MTLSGTGSKAHGGSKLNALVALLIVVSLFVGGIKIVPVYVRAYEFRDAMRSQAKFASVDRKAPEQVREELFRKAKQLELPVAREQIRVVPAPGGIAVAANFRVPVDLIVFQHEFGFAFNADTSTAY
jgi:hypothetical protein